MPLVAIYILNFVVLTRLCQYVDLLGLNVISIPGAVTIIVFQAPTASSKPLVTLHTQLVSVLGHQLVHQVLGYVVHSDIRRLVHPQLPQDLVPNFDAREVLEELPVHAGRALLPHLRRGRLIRRVTTAVRIDLLQKRRRAGCGVALRKGSVLVLPEVGLFVVLLMVMAPEVALRPRVV